MARVVKSANLLNLAKAILAGRDLEARQLAMDIQSIPQRFDELPEPVGAVPQERILAAALAELFAARRNESPPAWTVRIAGLDKPLYLLGDPDRYPRFYARCIEESPLPLKRRNLIAPADFLNMA